MALAIVLLMGVFLAYLFVPVAADWFGIQDRIDWRKWANRWFIFWCYVISPILIIVFIVHFFAKGG